MRFHFLTGDVNWLEYGGTWISSKQNNGEFDYWLAIRLLNWEDACGKDAPPERYNVELLSVSPSEAGAANIRQAFDCCGISGSVCDSPLAQVEALLSYGVYAHLWQGNGNNAHKLLREARKHAQLSGMLYDFYMDKAQNRIGSTGWEFQRGDLTAGLSRMKEPDEQPLTDEDRTFKLPEPSDE